MWSAGSDEVRLAFMHWVPQKELFDAPVLQPRDEIILGDSRLQSQQECRSRPGVDDMPHLGLAAAAGCLLELRRIFIIGMNLDGKLVIWKKKFDQQRKFAKLLGVRSTPFRRHIVPGFTERFSRKRAIRNPGLVGGQPRFAERLGQIRFIVKQRRQRMRSPRPRTENRFEAC